MNELQLYNIKGGRNHVNLWKDCGLNSRHYNNRKTTEDQILLVPANLYKSACLCGSYAKTPKNKILKSKAFTLLLPWSENDIRGWGRVCHFDPRAAMRLDEVNKSKEDIMVYTTFCFISRWKIILLRVCWVSIYTIVCLFLLSSMFFPPNQTNHAYFVVLTFHFTFCSTRKSGLWVFVVVAFRLFE